MNRLNNQINTCRMSRLSSFEKYLFLMNYVIKIKLLYSLMTLRHVLFFSIDIIKQVSTIITFDIFMCPPIHINLSVSSNSTITHENLSLFTGLFFLSSSRICVCILQHIKVILSLTYTVFNQYSVEYQGLITHLFTPCPFLFDSFLYIRFFFNYYYHSFERL
jgi:hypothetical protein